VWGAREYVKESRSESSLGRSLQAELKQGKPFASLEEEALLNVQRTADCFRRELQQTLKPYGITMTQDNALRILRGAGTNGLACSELGDRLVSGDPDITRLLGRLDRQGLVERRRDGNDRRIVLTVITSDGLLLLEKLVPVLDAAIRNSLRHLNAAKLGTLIDLLEALRAPFSRPWVEAEGN
jgi:DNA-binding MarR family transcriptional regulator